MINVSIGGPEQIILNEKAVTDIYFKMITPDDANARSTDQYTDLFIMGKILPSVSSEESEASVALDRWSAVTDDRADCYRPVTAKVTEAGVVLREYSLPNAFIVDYDTDFADDEGTGVFKLHVRQKKDKNKDVKVEGGYAAG